jgi:hypothetical protein
MGWKDWPYWLRDGIISVIFLGALVILSFYIPFLKSFFYGEWHGDYITNGGGEIIGVMLLLMYLLVSSIFLGSIGLMANNMPLFGVIISIILSVIYYFAIGAFISWIYVKIKGER